MRSSNGRPFVLALGAACAVLFSAAHAQAAPIWFEVGDAGELSSPQFVVGGPFDEIVGSIDGTNPEDAYAFHWTETGDFSAINLEPVVPDWIFLSLYDFGGQTVGPQLGELAVSAIGLSVPMLAAGDYILRLTFVPDPGKDPDYRIAISGPTADPITSPVPEPSTLMLLAGGLGSLAFRRRRLRAPVSRRLIALSIAAMCAVAFTAGSVQAAPIWFEVGDAGGLANPQFLTGPFDEIAGNLDLIDTEDTYAFHWSTSGDFSAINLEPVVPDFIALGLYDFTDRIAGAAIGNATSGSGLNVSALAAGDYLLRLLFIPDPGEDDPPYRIAITGPASNPVDAPVPEPSTLMLLAGGLATFASRARRRAR